MRRFRSPGAVRDNILPAQPEARRPSKAHHSQLSGSYLYFCSDEDDNDDTSRGVAAMAPRARDEIMVHDSIEAKGDEDVDMEDVTVDGNGDGQNETAGAPAGADANGEADAEVEADADGEPDTDGAADAEGQAEDDEPADTTTVRRGRGGGRGRWRSVEDPHKELRQLIDDTQKYLCAYKEE